MTNLIDALNALTDSIALLSPVRAIGLSGGARPLPAPGEGDIDLFVYCQEIPASEQRRAALESLGPFQAQVRIDQLQGGHWGTGDSLQLADVETWLLYFTIEETRTELCELLDGKYLDRVDAYYYPIGRCAMWRDMRALHDPDGFLASLRAQVAEYPAKLATANRAYHLGQLNDTEDLDRAVQRGEVLFYHFALDLVLDHLLQALFALNRVYFPSRKRSLEYIRAFEVQPNRCAERLLRMVELGATAETLAESRAEFLALARELRELGGS